MALSYSIPSERLPDWRVRERGGGGTQLQGMLMEEELEEALYETSAGLAAKRGGAMALLQRMEAVRAEDSLRSHVEVRLVEFDGVYLRRNCECTSMR